MHKRLMRSEIKKTLRVEKEKRRLQQVKRGDGGQQPGGFMCPLTPEGFLDICCLCRNTQGMLSVILSTRPE